MTLCRARGWNSVGWAKPRDRGFQHVRQVRRGVPTICLGARMERSEIRDQRNHATLPIPSSASPHPRLASTPWIRKTVFTHPTGNAPPARSAAGATEAHGPAPLSLSPSARCARNEGGGAPKRRSVRVRAAPWRGCEPRLRTLARRPRAPCDRDTRLSALHRGRFDLARPIVTDHRPSAGYEPTRGSGSRLRRRLVSGDALSEAGCDLLEQNGNNVKTNAGCAHSPRRHAEIDRLGRIARAASTAWAAEAGAASSETSPSVGR